jgi:hypothetical protein
MPCHRGRSSLGETKIGAALFVIVVSIPVCMMVYAVVRDVIR